MLTAKLILERFSKEGRLLERREKPVRSFVLQLMDFLYLKHTQANRDIRDIENTLRTVLISPNYGQISLLVASPGGHTGYARVGNQDQGALEGQDVGIQVGKGTTSPTPTDYKMEDRIKHGRVPLGKTGTPATFNNPSFETGDLTNWTEAVSGPMDALADNGVWALKDGTWYCYFKTTAASAIGDYAEISQDIDLTNITHLRFQLRGDTSATYFQLEILVDGHPIYKKGLSVSTDYPNELADVCAYTGTHTVTFRLTTHENCPFSDRGAFIDKIETLISDPEIEYGGCELINLTFSDPNGEFTIRRYFTNNSGVSITVESVGIQAGGGTSSDGWAFLIARDLTGGIAVADTEILRVTYVPQITV
jgi:hypothetical protein